MVFGGCTVRVWLRVCRFVGFKVVLLCVVVI